MKFLLVELLRFYKAAVSPWLPAACRFTPTCSQYAVEAIQKHGALHGTLLATWRVCRCQPFARGGFDPVK
jgi:putative membrane protein insertion efficiency factor